MYSWDFLDRMCTAMDPWGLFCYGTHQCMFSSVYKPHKILALIPISSILRTNLIFYVIIIILANSIIASYLMRDMQIQTDISFPDLDHVSPHIGGSILILQKKERETRKKIRTFFIAFTGCKSVLRIVASFRHFSSWSRPL